MESLSLVPLVEAAVWVLLISLVFDDPYYLLNVFILCTFNLKT